MLCSNTYILKTTLHQTKIKTNVKAKNVKLRKVKLNEYTSTCELPHDDVGQIIIDNTLTTLIKTETCEITMTIIETQACADYRMMLAEHHY